MIHQQSVFIDLEIHPDTQALLKIGAWRPDDQTCFYRDGRFDRGAACRELLNFIGDARFIIGHNIEQHDWPWLVEHDAAFSRLSDRLIDTLVLNPLAFPANPYHRLVKDYKLQRESVNDPVKDCKQTAILFSEQCETFAGEPEQSAIFSLLLLNSGASYFEFFSRLLQKPVTGKDVKHYINACLSDEAICQQSKKLVINEIRSNIAGSQRAMAYALAWLGTAGTNSVLPAWVRYQHPELSDILDALRNRPCGEASCKYCSTYHDLEGNLKQFSGYERFRQFGSDGDGDEPLQRRIVGAVVRGKPTLAILPTGGGKSLCYQLPAMMLARNRAQLSIVLSPLQSLMNDQVQQLQIRGYHYAATLNSSLTMPERHKVLEGIRMGDIHLLYIAPEQLRNTSFIAAIESREIGQWIIDEAHCLSKWGHDFRPDYLYIAKFVADFAKKHQQGVPPVHAFTATARQDVIEEILNHFEQRLGVRPQLLSGGHMRSNLSYQVLHCPPQEKRERVLSLLQEHREMIGEGATIIFCNRRKTTEEMAEFLDNNGWPSDFFHAGRDPHSKRRVQQSFMAGEIPVMAATNAFGMGVDKADVRLVIHAQMPDSLENYLQEAGRAGRDGNPARCMLLFDEADADKQFEMRRAQQIEFRDFVSLFEAMRGRGRKFKACDIGEDMIQASSGDILRMAHDSDSDSPGFDTRDLQYDTKVRTAIAWLEEAGLLERRENRTGVIEGTFKITAIDLIRDQLKKRKISDSAIESWIRVAHAIMQHEQADSINADQLAEQTGMEPRAVFRAIVGLQHAGVMDHDMSLVAWLKAHVAGDSRKALANLSELESSLFALIRDEMQGDSEAPFQLNIVHACHLLRSATGREDISPPVVVQLLALWIGLDKLVRSTPLGRDTQRLKWKMDFEQSEQQIRQRRTCSDVAINHLYAQIPAGEKGFLRVPFKLGALNEALAADLTTRHLSEQDERAEQALLALQQTDVLGLESGAAIFHSAMTLHIPGGTNKPGKAAFAPLLEHYKAQIRQVHLMREWSLRMAAGNGESASALLNDYFDLNEKNLLSKFFPGNEKAKLEIPASDQRVETIAGKMALSDQQRRIVGQSGECNMLVLAGPGAGKTRLIVHRVAWLVGIQRDKPESILILAFNRSTVTELRTRLLDPKMLGKRAWGLQIHTYHSLAMRLLGELPPDDKADFQQWSAQLMEKAATLLGDGDVDDEPDELRQRLIAGFRFILVDEYQDINQAQYRFLSALAGRTLEHAEEQLTMFAVGDDDQNIYEWNGAENRYIHQFEQDYHASIEYMTGNYRSAPEIIAVANRLISRHPGRLKAEHPIVAATQSLQGRVRLFEGAAHALHHRTVDVCRYLACGGKAQLQQTAILCRHHQEYEPLARLLRGAGLPICVINGKKSPYRWDRLREVHALISVFEGSGTINAEQVRQAWMATAVPVRTHPSTGPLWQWLDSYRHVEHIFRPRQEWWTEVWELAKSEGMKIGEGIWLGSMHSVKGLEFDNVIVFAGKRAGQDTFCEELRLRYVAMTRARLNLILMQSESFWFGDLEIDAEHLPLEAREPAADADIHLCSMEDVDIDYAGRSSTEIDASNIRTGEVISLNPDDGVYRQPNKRLGKLSRNRLQWLLTQISTGWAIDTVVVHVIVHRYKKDITETRFLDRCRRDQWDIILPEIRLKRAQYG